MQDSRHFSPTQPRASRYPQPGIPHSQPITAHQFASAYASTAQPQYQKPVQELALQHFTAFCKRFKQNKNVTRMYVHQKMDQMVNFVYGEALTHMFNEMGEIFVAQSTYGYSPVVKEGGRMISMESVEELRKRVLGKNLQKQQQNQQQNQQSLQHQQMQQYQQQQLAQLQNPFQFYTSYSVNGGFSSQQMHQHQNQPQQLPRQAPRQEPQHQPQHQLQQHPRQAPRQAPQQSPQHQPQHEPQQLPRQAPQHQPQHKPQQLPRQAPQQSPQHQPQHQPQHEPQQLPRQAPQQKPQQIGPQTYRCMWYNCNLTDHQYQNVVCHLRQVHLGINNLNQNPTINIDASNYIQVVYPTGQYASLAAQCVPGSVLSSQVPHNQAQFGQANVAVRVQAPALAQAQRSPLVSPQFPNPIPNLHTAPIGTQMISQIRPNVSFGIRPAALAYPQPQPQPKQQQPVVFNQSLQNLQIVTQNLGITLRTPTSRSIHSSPIPTIPPQFHALSLVSPASVSSDSALMVNHSGPSTAQNSETQDEFVLAKHCQFVTEEDMEFCDCAECLNSVAAMQNPNEEIVKPEDEVQEHEEEEASAESDSDNSIQFLYEVERNYPNENLFGLNLQDRMPQLEEVKTESVENPKSSAIKESVRGVPNGSTDSVPNEPIPNGQPDPSDNQLSKVKPPLPESSIRLIPQKSKVCFKVVPNESTDRIPNHQLQNGQLPKPKHPKLHLPEDSLIPRIQQKSRYLKATCFNVVPNEATFPQCNSQPELQNPSQPSKVHLYPPESSIPGIQDKSNYVKSCSKMLPNEATFPVTILNGFQEMLSICERLHTMESTDQHRVQTEQKSSKQSNKQLKTCHSKKVNHERRQQQQLEQQKQQLELMKQQTDRREKPKVSGQVSVQQSHSRRTSTTTAKSDASSTSSEVTHQGTKRKQPEQAQAQSQASTSSSSHKDFFMTISHKCSVMSCAQYFATKVELNEHHAKVHHLEQYMCYQKGCGQSFKNRPIWSNSTQLVPNGGCAQCDSVAKDYHRLDKHMNWHHYGGKFKCVKCDPIEDYLISLNRHFHSKQGRDIGGTSGRSRHAGPDQQSFSCSISMNSHK